jgi:hypothetical protein
MSKQIFVNYTKNKRVAYDLYSIIIDNLHNHSNAYHILDISKVWHNEVYINHIIDEALFTNCKLILLRDDYSNLNKYIDISHYIKLRCNTNKLNVYKTYTTNDFKEMMLDTYIYKKLKIKHGIHIKTKNGIPFFKQNVIFNVQSYQNIYI